MNSKLETDTALKMVNKYWACKIIINKMKHTPQNLKKVEDFCESRHH